MTATSRHHAGRAFHDRDAVGRARTLRDDPAVRPLDRAMLDAFAAYARAGGGAVADLGCGPGRTTAYLDRCGVRAFGVDLSPAMVAAARRAYPGLRFEVGRMAGLDVADGALGGVLSWYGTVRTPPTELPELFAEFARVLAPGGYALVAFEAGEGEGDEDGRNPAHPADPDVYTTPPGLIAGLLAGAGLAETARMVREPDEGEPGPRGFVLARRPPTP
ncbi:class I SAM-dependent methyltransferase [Streptomyces sp. NPDC001373]|uniref:class I SAM-dependent methyltransferase n=1 Tax=Streptomyces sp. NPDC001373 TaxID=3364565 RepID=UPI0036C5B6EF